MATLSNNDIARAIYLVSREKTHTELQEINRKVIKFLDRRRFLSKSKDILEKLNNIINIESGKITVKVLSAKKLNEELKKELIFFLKKRYGVKEILLTETLDEKLLGGIRLEVNDEIIDLIDEFKVLDTPLTKKKFELLEEGLKQNTEILKTLDKPIDSFDDILKLLTVYFFNIKGKSDFSWFKFIADCYFDGKIGVECIKYCIDHFNKHDKKIYFPEINNQFSPEEKDFFSVHDKKLHKAVTR